MSDYFCRIRVPYEKFSPVASLMSEKCERLIIYEHNDDPNNIHIHFYIQACQVSTDTLKNYCKRHGITGGKKGSNWSFKLARDTGCIKYMTKGKYEPKFVKGFTDDEVAEHKSLWEDREPIIVNGKVQSKLTFVVKETPLQAKKRKNDLVEEMIKCLPKIRSDKMIIQTIIKVLNDNQTIFSRYTIRDYFDTIQGRVNEKAFVDKMEIFCAYNR